MGILIFAVLVILIVGVLCWAVSILPIPAPFNSVAQALLVILAVIIIANRAGVV